MTSADLRRLGSQFGKMAHRVNLVAFSRSTIQNAVDNQFAAAQEREEAERQQRAAEERVADELMREIADQLIQQTVEEAKQQVCREDGLPPDILQMLQEYDVI